ncbi:recombinase family protein [Oryzicola mucosus]|uniref:Recombinase family protein n=1 Tax=Oryzicola mucosus TaxID=2767425 RepID=A0A8J6PSW9_9HYPH|nr:recombinase family protein [Oryzicola mucosus]MBD0413168.1 recombinase family protein [Oryzicola mucosus]
MKGLWMGGVVPLGYSAEDKKLVVHPRDAERVRWLFQRYLELKSVPRLSDEAMALPVSESESARFARSFRRGNLYYLLSNPVYIGKVRHKLDLHEGEHPQIIDRATFDAAQALLSNNKQHRS